MSKLFGYLGLFLTLTFFVATARNIRKISAIKDIAKNEEIRLKKVEEENNRLKEQLSIMQSASYEEKIIRDRLGLVKEGETVVVLPEEEILKKLSPLRGKKEEVKPLPNWKKWMKLFI